MGVSGGIIGCRHYAGFHEHICTLLLPACIRPTCEIPSYRQPLCAGCVEGQRGWYSFRSRSKLRPFAGRHARPAGPPLESDMRRLYKYYERQGTSMFRSGGEAWRSGGGRREGPATSSFDLMQPRVVNLGF